MTNQTVEMLDQHHYQRPTENRRIDWAEKSVTFVVPTLDEQDLTGSRDRQCRR